MEDYGCDFAIFLNEGQLRIRHRVEEIGGGLRVNLAAGLTGQLRQEPVTLPSKRENHPGCEFVLAGILVVKRRIDLCNLVGFFVSSLNSELSKCKARSSMLVSELARKKTACCGFG